MPDISPMTIRCSACGQPFNLAIRTIVDAAADPQGKAALLTGQLNSARCPHCRAANTVAAPLLYHDPEKELLVAYVPMELNLNKDEQEKVIGDLLRGLPKENFKAYMFQPKRALTMQGLVDLVLQADGVTPEMMEQQRERIRIAQELVDAPPEKLPDLVAQHDSLIDIQFFQTLTMMAQRVLEAGRPDLAQHIVMVQGRVGELSTVGRSLIDQQERQEQIVAEVAQRLQSLGQGAQRSDFLELALKFADDDQRLQALAGLARPVFDYTFFQEMTVKIAQAPAAERDALASLRDRLLNLTSAIDQQSRAVVENAVSFLQALLSESDPDELLQSNIHLLDSTFMAVLSANIQEAERRGDERAVARLKHIYERTVTLLQQNMQPELVFINQLLSASTEEEARALLADRIQEFGEPLLHVMDAVHEALDGQGQQALQHRLLALRQQAADALA